MWDKETRAEKREDIFTGSRKGGCVVESFGKDDAQSHHLGCLVQSVIGTILVSWKIFDYKENLSNKN